MRDRSMRSGTRLAREIQLTDWSTAGNLSYRSSGVQIPRDFCTRFGRYLYSTKCSWIIKLVVGSNQPERVCDFLSHYKMSNRMKALATNTTCAISRGFSVIMITYAYFIYFFAC